MQGSEKDLEKFVSKLDDERSWLLKNIDSGKWPEIRKELASLEREISKLILRLKDVDSEIKKFKMVSHQLLEQVEKNSKIHCLNYLNHPYYY